MPDSAPVSPAAHTAFSKQAIHFDADDRRNPVLIAWRKRVYDHVQSFLRPGSHVLELNSGTGIDAVHFSNLGYRVHATDAADGMIRAITDKTRTLEDGHISVQQLSYEHLDQVDGNNFDYAFSNFGGLNCVRELRDIGRQLSTKLRPGAFVTWVIMPPFSPWELLWIAKGKWNDAFRRFRTGGAVAHLEGEYFTTYYHSLTNVRRALGHSFQFVRAEGLGVIAPPPSATRFYHNHPGLSRILESLDQSISRHAPFNRWGDHIIVTFQRI